LRNRGVATVLCAFRRLTWLVVCAACAWSQTPDAAVASFTGREFILVRGGESQRIKLKKSQVDRMKGGCDLAVAVRDAAWNKSTARFTLQNIGRVTVATRPAISCRNAQDEIALEISGFAPDESAESILSTVRRVIQTPEEYLESKGIHFALPPVAEDEVPVRPPPPVTNPKPLLRVDGTYTEFARSAKRKGTVTMSLVIGTDGRAHKVRLIHQVGFGLDENAIRVIRLWRFEPARQMDKPVAYASHVEMSFDIF